jgi:hypothetical protein
LLLLLWEFKLLGEVALLVIDLEEEAGGSAVGPDLFNGAMVVVVDELVENAVTGERKAAVVVISPSIEVVEV